MQNTDIVEIFSSPTLSNVRVIDLSTNILGPCATQLLGDAGADVIKVEPPVGDPVRALGPSRSPGMGSIFMNLNRSKRSLVLDLKTDREREILRRLIGTADVFVHNMRPKAISRLGFGYNSVSAINEKIVYASAAGFRPSSSLRDRGAYDDVIQGLTGLASMNRGLDGSPRFFPTAIADKLTGYVLAMSVLMALFARQTLGRGQEVSVPMIESVAAFTMIEHLWGETLQMPQLGVGYERQLSPGHRPYPTKDGFICLLAVTDDQWQRLFPALERPELAGDPRFATISARTANLGSLFAVLEEALAKKSTSEWISILDRIDVPNGKVNDLLDLLVDPYLVETGFFEKREHPTEGPVTVLSIPAEFSDTPAKIDRLAPRIGEHNNEILSELEASSSRRT